MLNAAPVADFTAPPVMQPSVQSTDVTPLVSSNPLAFYTPAQVRTAYGLGSIAGQGQGQTIAIVDAYSQPYIQSDVNEFSSIFGLPQMDGVGGDPTLSIKVPTGQSTPPTAPPAGNWGVEISLDVEWVHAVAPYANIVLVTCQNSSGDSLFGAEIDGQPYASGVGYAKSLPGVSVVSNSYGGGEFNGETQYDSQFTTPAQNVAFVFSTGDDGAPSEYPAYSPNVVAVGGTSLNTASIKGRYGNEIGWNGSGGGISQYEATPSFQSSNGVNFGARSVPDVSWLADPNTGVLVINSLDDPGFLSVIGGTSLAAPMWAGLIALGDQARGSAGSLSSQGVLNALYGAYNSSHYSQDFHDITAGNNGFAAGTGYDLVTGIGTPQPLAITNLLAGATPATTLGGTAAAKGRQATGFPNIVYSPGTGGANSRISGPMINAANPSALQAGSTPDFLVVTMDIPKPKGVVSLTSS
ncbi:MAG: S53 family peptidase [Paludisphaera borealis]|uniref:S53 family peptidase n=1 Tax=Paludisphaera borealis TaxID=1387353 RepID=UPI002846A801|nr:S53 family peptidase [Paludisphaera borealis]MDR3618456.1 S53 family peptidase [Paludisphaera borealis]